MSRIGTTIISDSGTVNNDGRYMVIKLCLVVCPRLVLTTTTILAAGFVVQKIFASIRTAKRLEENWLFAW